MAEPPRRRWEELSAADFAALDAGRAIAVLPVAAIEQHGPHLPLSVDACIADGILDAACASMPAALPVLILPMQRLGKSDEHIGYPGTLTLSAETLIRQWNEIGDAVARAGIRKLLFFNSHGGNPPVMEIVARDLRLRHAMLAVQASWWDLADLDALFDAAARRHDVHGGAVETSVMLHLRPDLVDMARAADFRSTSQDMAADFARLAPVGRTPFAWAAQDLNPQGVAGNAAAADAERGGRAVESAARGLVALLEDIDRFDLSRLAEAPSR